MKKEYKVKKVSLEEAGAKNIWDSIQPARIESYVWDENHYRPEAYAKVFYTDTHLHVKLVAYEKEVRAVNTGMNEPVYQDSCLEFFVKPNPEKDGRYMNFETNSIGAMLLGIGDERTGRTLVTDEKDFASFEINTSLNYEEAQTFKGDCWSVEYKIPFAFIEKIYGKLEYKKGKRMEANFYKCGDGAKYPHYGSWNEIVAPQPDFHRPECFGEIILE